MLRAVATRCVCRAVWLFVLLSCVYPSASLEETYANDDGSTEDFPFPSMQPWVGVNLDDTNSTSGSYRQCKEDSVLLHAAFRQKRLWATRMVDASATHVTGALWGHRYQLGSFDGCHSAGVSSPLGGARYCLVRLAVRHAAPGAGPRRPWEAVTQLHPDEDARPVLSGANQLEGYFPPGEVFLAQCVPPSCSPAALEAAARAALQRSPASPDISVAPRLCQDSAELSRGMPASAKLFWCLMGVLTGLSFVGPYLGWSWWNWKSHVRVLAQEELPIEGMNLTCLSGIRFFSATLTFGAHVGLTLLNGAISNASTANAEVIISYYILMMRLSSTIRSVKGV